MHERARLRKGAHGRAVHEAVAAALDALDAARALRGQAVVARELGIDESVVSRWFRATDPSVPRGTNRETLLAWHARHAHDGGAPVSPRAAPVVRRVEAPSALEAVIADAQLELHDFAVRYAQDILRATADAIRPAAAANAGAAHLRRSDREADGA